MHSAPPELSTLSLHDALPISAKGDRILSGSGDRTVRLWEVATGKEIWCFGENEEHTSELQSRQYLVCRLLLEKKKNNTTPRLRQHDINHSSRQILLQRHRRHP